MRTEYFVLPILVVVLGAVAVWALVLPTEPQLAAAESAFAGMLATGVALVTGRLPRYAPTPQAPWESWRRRTSGGLTPVARCEQTKNISNTTTAGARHAGCRARYSFG